MTDDYVAGFNSCIASGCDLIAAVREGDAEALADAIEHEGDVHDEDARDLLLACLRGLDRATEIINQRRAGDRHRHKYPLDLVRADFSTGLNTEERRSLVAGLRSGAILIRARVQSGKRGPRPKIFTEQVCRGAAIEDRAIKWAVRVKGLNAFELRSGQAPIPRGAWAAGIRITATLKRLKSVSADPFVAQSENRDFAIIELQKDLQAWRRLVRR